ncbi:hypothetical protein LSUE1_G010309, partial [Lachnellula suecica]
MLSSLTTARLDLASTASSNLSKLIAKLETLVSIVPPPKAIEQEEEEDDDPTELFHRDIGIQTSPPRSRSSSPPPDALAAQSTRLAALTSHLKDVQTDSNTEGSTNSELQTTLDVLREYLDGLAYVAPVYNYGYGGNGSQAKDEDDEIGRVKAGIRGVK